MEWPEFTLKNLPAVLGFEHETEEPTVGFGGRDAGANPSQQTALGGTRIAQWADACGRYASQKEFAQRLDGRQVEAELSAVFRDTPEFGRSLALRLADFHDSKEKGDLALIGGGGEAVVFGDSSRQRVLKLLGGACKAGFGWMIDRDAEGRWILRSGGLEEALIRFWLMEKYFPTGLDVEVIGEGGTFLVLSQPFLVGENPTMAELSVLMKERGWAPFSPPSELEVISGQTWIRGRILASDVRSENAILAEADGAIYPFDLILAAMPLE